MNRLILTEGLPCSGKSTASEFFAQKLNAKLFDEGSGEHPADYEFHAYIKNEELCCFSDEEQAKIKRLCEKKPHGYIVPLGRFEGKLFDRLLEHKIYDFLPWECEKQVMLEKWREFADSVQPDERYAFNCVFLQNPMCETMMRFNFDTAVSYEYINSIYSVIKPLEPFVIYLYTDDIRSSIEKSAPERGSQWLQSVIEYHCGGEYGKAHGLCGFEGYISALEERQRRELEILKRLGVQYTVIDAPFEDRQRAYSQVLQRL